MRISLTIFCFSVLLLLCGCPPDVKSGNRAAKQPIQPEAELNPSQPIPSESSYLEYAGLRLGMGALELSQVYNAPKGRGDGFARVIEYFGDVHNHIIEFDRQDGEPKRKMIASLYRDRLYIVVDSREWINPEQRDNWWAELIEKYGSDYKTILPSSQWSWGDPDGVLITFTQDNASEKLMNCNVVLEHKPTRVAAHNYNVWWDQNHPEKSKDSTN